MSRLQSQPVATDWTEYYASVPATAKVTRKYTTAVLLDSIRRFVPATHSGISIVEIGGANSCFLDAILSAIRPRAYDIIDTNEFGLSLLAKRPTGGHCVRLHQQSVLDLSFEGEADVVFSVGLVEHFTPQDTRKAILAHFEPLRPGGIAIISFPTPTLLYRIARNLIEALGMWKFHDERPLSRNEVLDSVSECADVLFQRTLWPLILTQHLVVARKR